MTVGHGKSSFTHAGRNHRYHARIANVLEAQFADIVQSQPELLAHHYTEAGLSAQAIPYWHQAGQHAMERSGYREAVACFEQALIVLQRLPECRDTREQAIGLHFDLRNAFLPLGEQARIFDHLREAETLAQVLDDRQRLGQVAVFMSEYFRMEGDLDQALEHGQLARSLARTLGDVGLQVVANFYVGIVYYELGDFRQAAECLRWNVVSLEGDLIHEHFGMTGLPSVLSRAYLSWSLAELGVFAEGTARGEEGLWIAQTMDHPFSLIWAYVGIGKLYVDQGNFHRAILMLERGLELCQAWDIPTLFPQMARTLGTAYVLSGRVTEAMPLLEQAASKGRRGSQAVSFTHLSKGYLLDGCTEDALKYAQLALNLAQDYKRRGYQAYALHLLGEIAVHHKPPEVEQASVRYRQALALAEELGMRPLQAHCHCGLGTLYSQTGQSAQSRVELSTAIDMYRDMEMTFWLPETEAALAAVEGQ